MRRFTILAGIGGLLAGTVVIAYFGFGQVTRALLAIGWGGFAAILVYRLAATSLLGFCWSLLARPPVRRAAFVWGRLIRDSAAEVLPLSQVGGFVMGARAATLMGVSGTVAIASTVVDVTLEALGQMGYTALGLSIMAARQPTNRFIAWTIFGLCLAVLALVAFAAMQRHGFGRLGRLLALIASHCFSDAVGRLAPVGEALRDIWNRSGALWLAGLLHFGAWIVSGVEAWLALHFMGLGIGLASVLAIESLLHAIRSVAFAVPNALGVQEGAYILIGGMFGLPPEAALALSLLKRSRDLVIGAPALLSWQLAESGRLLAERSAALDPVKAGSPRRAKPFL